MSAKIDAGVWVDLKTLWDLGFALHWLRSKSEGKEPVESGWTKGPRKTWDELRRGYRPGYNVGVRLGQASRLSDGTYLAVIDCDVKGSEAKYSAELNQKIDTLFPDFSAGGTARVRSGRGNGSRHLYIRTTAPLTPVRVAQSSEKTRVYMPSVQASSTDRKTLPEKDLAEGYRSRAAWEVSLMGEGQQVVLPPSLHPDTGKIYTWDEIFPCSLSDIPLIDLGQFRKDTPKTIVSSAPESDLFLFPEVDLLTSTLPVSILNLIVDGEGCEDRSAGLWKVASTMIREGWKDAEIVSVLTERGYYLGLTAYDHAKTESREKAALWVKKYTIDKARQELDFTKAFSDAIVEVPLDEAGVKSQSETIAAEQGSTLDWRSILRRANPKPGQAQGSIKPTYYNLCLIFENAFDQPVFRFDEFKIRHIHALDCPWGAKKDSEVNDDHVLQIRHWLDQIWHLDYGKDLIHDAINQVAYRHAFHPVRDFLGNLEWDGVSRLDTWLADYLKAEGDPLVLAEMGRKTVLAMVARIFRPGVKFDHVLMLEGGQGIGKSTAVSILGYKDRGWVTDTYLNLADKDAVLNIQGNWIVELSELAGVARADMETLKSFLSREVDRIRPPFERRVRDFPRQSIFIGTTNASEYVKDETGGRRFWPVRIAPSKDKSWVCDIDGLRSARDQMFAEAVFRWQVCGESIHVESVEVALQLHQEIQERVFQDVIVDTVRDFLAKQTQRPSPDFDPVKFTLNEFLTAARVPDERSNRDLGDLKNDKSTQLRIASALVQNGFRKKITRYKGVAGVSTWILPKSI